MLCHSYKPRCGDELVFISSNEHDEDPQEKVNDNEHHSPIMPYLNRSKLSQSDPMLTLGIKSERNMVSSVPTFVNDVRKFHQQQNDIDELTKNQRRLLMRSTINSQPFLSDLLAPASRIPRRRATSPTKISSSSRARILEAMSSALSLVLCSSSPSLNTYPSSSDSISSNDSFESTESLRQEKHTNNICVIMNMNLLFI